MKIFDTVIIGGGPAGIAAGIYAARYRLETCIIAKQYGGTCTQAHMVENWPGISKITGSELGEQFIKHLADYPVEKVTDEVRKIEFLPDKKIYQVYLREKKYLGKTLILALGTERRKLNIPGEKEFLGKGISYCATCDSTFFKDREVAVIGGSDAAVTAALLLAQHAAKIYLIYRKENLRAEPIWVDRAENHKKIEIIRNTNVIKINGENVVKSIQLDKEHNGKKDLAVSGVFVEIGAVPAVSLAQGIGVETDERNMIKINNRCETNISGVYAAGDITSGFCELDQIITAAAEGAVAATSAYKYVMAEKK